LDILFVKVVLVALLRYLTSKFHTGRKKEGWMKKRT